MSGRRPLPAAAVALLACPGCGAPLAPVDGDAGLRCDAGHAFDRARQGHVTLLPPGRTPPTGDSAQMVADRVEFLGSGAFAGVSRALGDAVLAGEGPAGEPPATLLDLGGGTGHHLAAVLERLPDAVGVVLDASRYAARRAAGVSPRVLAVVADAWARLPVRDAAVDRVLGVFAPRNGPETARVLAPGGRLVVVTPAPDHLVELVAPLGLLRVDPDKDARLAGTLEPHLAHAATTVHREVRQLPRADVVTLVGMGPHARHLSPDALVGAVAGLPEPVRVTVAVQVTSWVRGV
ncbi:putative RNA methyltransferase [Trujillonella endophytica]|uniref:23S rRNA m(1)G-748 methyltransferase n=1 Tax=Trujillonella endophytica TaxID=673521 RepID=A0A1H8UTL9_9ACTN|nr:23S rRNA methyltransferase [Trujillella endophytica]SEP06254.1 23S rRNA m(1)G-748 methyltransferase [Trujillella endophytica]